MTTAEPGSASRARIAARMAATVPGLGETAVQRILVTAKVDRGRALHEVDACLQEHPGALTAALAEYPLALVRLAHELIEAGYQTVAAPACARCGKTTIDLRRKASASAPPNAGHSGPKRDWAAYIAQRTTDGET